MQQNQSFFKAFRFIPIVTVESTEQALAFAEQACEKDIPILEVTLRTQAALPAIKAIAKQFPRLTLAAGTILSVSQLNQARDAGAEVFISPGFDVEIAGAAVKQNLYFLPGVLTPTEVMAAKQFGLSHLKLFPASLLNGSELLRTYAQIFPDILFCPTGGINQGNYEHYLQQENVFAVGGSWLLN